MGVSQSNIVTASELVATGAVIAASAYFLAPGSSSSSNDQSGSGGPGKQSAKNKRKRENAKKAKTTDAPDVDVTSSVDTLAASSRSIGKVRLVSLFRSCCEIYRLMLIL